MPNLGSGKWKLVLGQPRSLVLAGLPERGFEPWAANFEGVSYYYAGLNFLLWYRSLR